MSRKIMPKMMIWLVAALLVLGCVSPFLATPPPSTQVPGALEDLIARTALAAQTETAFYMPPTQTPTVTRPPTGTPTETPTPTSTVIFTFFTSTSVLLNTPSGSSGSGDDDDNGGGPDNSQPQWACDLISKSPANGTVFRPKENFRAVWSLRNAGYSVWGINTVDYRYLGGADLSGRNAYDFTRSVPSGGTIAIIVDMTAPNKPGFYSTRWTLRVGNTNFCAMKISIEVQ